MALTQMALDSLDFDATVALAETVAPHVDILEIGTPCIKHNGIKLLETLKAKFPNNLILVDLKTMDAGEYEAEPFYKAGADICTVLGASGIATIKGVIAAAKKYGKECQVDMINVSDKESLAKEAVAAGADIIGVHTGLDAQAAGHTPFADLADIAAAVGIKDVATGDSLCDEKAPVALESIDVPPAVISSSVEPKNKGEYEKMALALRKMMLEDPSFRYSYDKETGQTVISGMGELHLEVVVDRLKREQNVDLAQGKMQVAYKETIQKPVDVEAKYIKQSGGRGQYGHVWIKFEPLERGKAFEFENAVTGGSIPREFIAPVEKGLLACKDNGVIANYPMVDFKAVLHDGSYHDVDSSEEAFKAAARMAFRKGMQLASPVLLEPVMKVEVETPEEYMGDVMGDLNSRRGRILGMEAKGAAQTIMSEVPLAEMVGYATDLRSMTKGRATYAMEFECYREVPKQVQEEIAGEK